MMKKTEAPKINITKEIISKGDEYIHCCLCQYGRKAGSVLWRIEFSGEVFSFHWILCNRCRFLMFKTMGGKRYSNLMMELTFGNDGRRDSKQRVIDSAKAMVVEPKQKVSIKGKIKSSYYYSMSLDRRRALDKGMSVKEYENKHARFIEKKKKKDRKKKK